MTKKLARNVLDGSDNRLVQPRNLRLEDNRQRLGVDGTLRQRPKSKDVGDDAICMGVWR
jgi:hypothetical protein